MAFSATESLWDDEIERPSADHEDSVWSAWSRTVDHFTIGACFVLFAIGVVLAFAASPALVARQAVDLPVFHYAWRHLVMGLPAFFMLFAFSFLGARGVKRIGAILTIACIAALLLLPTLGVDMGKASTRWIELGGVTIQPTEFLKPGLVVVCAAFLSALATHDPAVRRGGVLLALGAVSVAAALLISQPDYSQTGLVLAVWAVMYFVAGGSLWTLCVVGGATLVIASAAYMFEPHFSSRIDAFMFDESLGNTQIDYARQAVANGGWIGVGVGEGVAKAKLPDAHADFILAVAAEEYGFALVLAIIAMFVLLPLRAIIRVADNEDAFVRVAVTGLAMLIGLQAFVNIAVTAQIVPVTGVTLPFISYGGSSMVATGAAMGMLLALTRRRPRDFSLDLDSGR